MTVVIIGPVTEDLIIKGTQKESKIGGAIYFQSFVFENFYPDYLAVVNCSDENVANVFANPQKVKVIKKDETHFFVNDYPFPQNLDIRRQSSNFADISITKNDLEPILKDIAEIDAFILNPLNVYDFPHETIEYLKSFDVAIYISLQGFLRHQSDKTDDLYLIELKLTPEIIDIISSTEGLFLDESEALILTENNDFNDFNINEIIITNGSKGSRVISDEEYKIEAVECRDIVDSTGCGDTFMAAYISKKLTTDSILKSANFASKIASEKLGFFGPFKSDI